MNYCWSTIHVSNLERSLKFYRDILGLPLLNRFQNGSGPDIAFLGDGDTKIELLCNPQGPVCHGESLSLGFEVPSLERAMAFMEEAGIPLHSGPFQPNPKTRFFFVQDPDGVLIQLVEERE